MAQLVDVSAGTLLPLLVRLLAVFMAVSIPVAVLNGTLFSWHPAFMAVGFLGLMSEGVLRSVSFRPLEGSARTLAIQSHMWWQLASVSCVVLGFLAIEVNKIRHGNGHFHSWHAVIGFTTSVLTLLAASGGVVSFKKLGLLGKVPDRWQPIFKAGHRYVGLVTWLLGLVAAELMMVHESVYKDSTLSWLWRLGIAGLGAAVLALAVQGFFQSLLQGHAKYASLEADMQLTQRRET